MDGLVTHHLLFRAEVLTPLELDDHSGAALRGSFFEAVWRRFCTNKAAATCADCPLHTMCPVSALVAPLREENPRGRDIPRPYVILPPLGEARRYEPGQSLMFGITLFGNIIQMLPYIVMSIEGLEAHGLGHKIAENSYQRGRFEIKQIESYHPLHGTRQIVYQAGKPLVNVPTLSVTASEVKARAASLPTYEITLNFLTPTRLKDQEQFVRRALFRPLIHRLLERLNALQIVYGGGDGRLAEEQQKYVELAEQVRCKDDMTRWQEVKSYSHRMKSFSPIGGIIGRATFVGDLTAFRELLTWGELVHVGKNCVKGNGWYKIED
jgi:hypothetical protein